MKYWRLIFAGLAFAAALGLFLYSSVHKAIAPTPSTKPLIAASFYPLGFAAQQLAGDTYDVFSVTPGGVEPHDFQPTPQDILRLQTATILFQNGSGVDTWVDRLKPTLEEHGVKVVNMSGLLQEQAFPFIESFTNEEGETSATAQRDPHFWLDPQTFAGMVQGMKDALSQAFPSDKVLFSQNAQAFTDKLQLLDKTYSTGLANCSLKQIIVSHNAFGYMARRYHFSVIPIAGFSPQEQPSAKHLADLVDVAKHNGVKTVFFETLVSPKLAETLAQEVGASTAVLDPIEGVGDGDQRAGKNYLTIMNDNLQALRTAMQCQ